MKRSTLYATVVSLGLSTIVPISAADRPQETPRLLAAHERQRAEAPRGPQRVAVVKLRIAAKGGGADRVDVRSVELIDSYAPKVFARWGGDWRVTLHGRSTTSYRINNPLHDIEIESPEGSEAPYRRIVPSKPIDWTLVVPLYKDGRALGTRRIEIRDEKAGRVLANIPLRDGGSRRSRSR